jgi:flagellin-like hook-associated protein FlgL
MASTAQRKHTERVAAWATTITLDPIATTAQAVTLDHDYGTLLDAVATTRTARARAIFAAGAAILAAVTRGDTTGREIAAAAGTSAATVSRWQNVGRVAAMFTGDSLPGDVVVAIVEDVANGKGAPTGALKTLTPTNDPAKLAAKVAGLKPKTPTAKGPKTPTAKTPLDKVDAALAALDDALAALGAVATDEDRAKMAGWLARVDFIADVAASIVDGTYAAPADDEADEAEAV